MPAIDYCYLHNRPKTFDEGKYYCYLCETNGEEEKEMFERIERTAAARMLRVLIGKYGGEDEGCLWNLSTKTSLLHTVELEEIWAEYERLRSEDGGAD